MTYGGQDLNTVAYILKISRSLRIRELDNVQAQVHHHRSSHCWIAVVRITKIKLTKMLRLVDVGAHIATIEIFGVVAAKTF